MKQNCKFYQEELLCTSRHWCKRRPLWSSVWEPGGSQSIQTGQEDELVADEWLKAWWSGWNVAPSVWFEGYLWEGSLGLCWRWEVGNSTVVLLYPLHQFKSSTGGESHEWPEAAAIQYPQSGMWTVFTSLLPVNVKQEPLFKLWLLITVGFNLISAVRQIVVLGLNLWHFLNGVPPSTGILFCVCVHLRDTWTLGWALCCTIT